MTVRREPSHQTDLDTGFTVLELLVVVAVSALALAAVVPAASDMTATNSLRAASHMLASEFRLTRTQAVFDNVNMAMVFRNADTFSVYRDGNNNGVRTSDIASGIDVKVRGPIAIDGRTSGVQIAISAPPPIPEIPPESGHIANLNDPIKIGPYDILGCSPIGTCASGTVYLSVPNGRMVAVRFRGAAGRVLLWKYDPKRKRWAKTW